MTAEIGILNKTAVVLAGDSAVTIGDGKKVYNTANKIFQLTSKGTVGIMIYNQANWMGIPLETIVKSYNKVAGEIQFSTLEEYRDSFIDFIKTNIFKFVSSKSQEDIVNYKCFEIIQSLAETGIEILEDEIKDGKTAKPIDDAAEALEISKRIQGFAKVLSNNLQKDKSKLTEFEGYKINDFKKKYATKINEIADGFAKQQKLTFAPGFKSHFIKIVYLDIVQKISNHEDYCGIVIAGFGEDEIFPKILDFKLAELFENRLRIHVNEPSEIDDNKVAIIRPFAQRDMVDTFMQGIEPNLLERIRSYIQTEFRKIELEISTKWKVDSKELKSILEKSFKTIAKRTFDYRHKKHVDPVVTTVSYLNKEGLIELAESLVNITSLKRKTSSDVETVGGPVDIALITKGDGFKWIKCKSL